MKVIIEEQNTPDIWRLGTEANLRIAADASFDTSDGQYIPQGQGASEFYLDQPCEISGNTLKIPSVELDATEDSLTNPSATYSAVLYVPRRGLIKPAFFSRFRVPATLPNTTWPLLRIHNAAQPRKFFYNYITLERVESLIAIALTYLRLGSPTQVGMLALQDPPEDSSFPLALGPNSRLVARAMSDGTDVLVAGEATVLSANVLPTSMILPIKIDDTITGKLEAFNKIEATSFQVRSDNGEDAGVFGWLMW